MKKSIIAGAASAVLASLPVAGVFATANSVTDYVQLTVNASCTMSATAISDNTDGDGEDLGRINLGSTNAPGSLSGNEGNNNARGTVMTVTCNDEAGWAIKATATALTGGTNHKDINFGAYAEGDTSVWSAQLALGGTAADAVDTKVSITEGWQTFAGSKTGSETVVAQDVNAAGVNAITITPSYKAYVAANQEAGTYTGSITYAFAEKDA